MLYLGNLHKGHESTLWHGVVVRCDRGHSVLCNPFRVTSEDKRDASCEQFQAYFNKKVREKTDAAFMNELRRIYQLALRQDVTLACWCYPKRCHTQTIKAFLEQYLHKAPHYTRSKHTRSEMVSYAASGKKNRRKNAKRTYGIAENTQGENTAQAENTLQRPYARSATIRDSENTRQRKLRKACALHFIKDWLYILRAGEMTSRQFVEEQYKYCVTNYSRRFADSFAYKAECVLSQVRSIEKRYYRYFESDGTIALSGIHNPKDAGMRYHPYVVIHWRDEEQKPAQPKADVRTLQRQADEVLPDELKSTHLHLYREGRADHSWLEGIQTERANREAQTWNQHLLQQLKDKYAK